MRSNKKTKDGFKKRAYPETRAGREPLKFRHLSTPEGRTFAIMVVLIGDRLVGGTNELVMSREFKANGLSKEALFKQVMVMMPGYAKFYYERSGKPLTPEICYSRWYMKVVYMNGPNGTRGKGRGAQGPEHPTASRRLRDCLPRVEEAFLAGLPLSITQMAELGEPNAQELPQVRRAHGVRRG